jgi:hypothetical protein
MRYKDMDRKLEGEVLMRKRKGRSGSVVGRSRP